MSSNSTLTALIVDDEALARTRLRSLLGECLQPAVRVEAEATNAAQAMAWLAHHAVDLALVDVHMPGADGLALAKSMAAMAQPPLVIFVTAHAEHAVQAFELDAMDYLTKPVRLQRLQQSLQKVERTLQLTRTSGLDMSPEVVLIQERGRLQRVPLSQVVYLKAELKYITLRTRERSHLLEGSLNELEEKYQPYFLRIHRNALVAKRAVRALERHHDLNEGEGWAVRLNGVDELLAVSRRQVGVVREVLAQA